MNMKNNILKSIIFGTALLSLGGCTKEYVIGPDVTYENGNIVLGKELVTYNILVACDKETVDALSGGNAELHKEKVDEFLANAAKFINDAGQGNLKYEFKFEAPDPLVIFEGNSEDYWDTIENDPENADYDMIMTMDGMENYGETYSNCQSGGGNIHMSYKGDNGTAHDYFSGEDYKVMAHESGHAFFAFPDLYLNVISHNEVNGEVYEIEDIMNKQNKYSVWSDYTLARINAGMIRGKENFEKPIDSAKEIVVTAIYGGQPTSGAKVTIYGGTQNNNGYGNHGDNWIYQGYIKKSCIIEEATTGSEGTAKIVATNLLTKKLSLAQGIERWYSILIEVEYDGKKGYKWLHEYELQMPALESDGENLIYEATVEIK